MAQSLRRPLSSLLGLSSTTSRRCFSRYEPLRNFNREEAQMKSLKPHATPDRSLRVATKDANQIPSDLGLLPYTYVPPRGNNLPSPLTSPNDFLHTQWNKIWYKTRDLFSVVVFKWTSPAAKPGGYKRSVKLQRSTIAPTAVALHRQMYTAFGEGDIRTLRKICCDGIYDTLNTRIGNRRKGDKVLWELVKSNAGAKMVSYRAARLPMDGAAIVQAIVRVSSRQRLTRWRKEKEGMVMVEGTGKEKDVVEYMVVQRLYKDWKEGEWMVWGTTKETVLDDVDAWVREQKAMLQ